MSKLNFNKEKIAELTNPELISGGHGLTISWARWRKGIQIVNGRPVIP